MGNSARIGLVLIGIGLLIGAGQAGADDAAPSAADNAAGSIPTIDRQILLDYLGGKVPFTLIDARSEAEFEVGHVYNATNVPHDAVDEFADRLPAAFDAPIVVYCRTGKRAALLRESLIARGYTDVRVLGPVQMFWSGDLPVFNCGETAASGSNAPIFERSVAD